MVTLGAGGEEQCLTILVQFYFLISMLLVHINHMCYEKYQVAGLIQSLKMYKRLKTEAVKMASLYKLLYHSVRGWAITLRCISL